MSTKTPKKQPSMEFVSIAFHLDGTRDRENIETMTNFLVALFGQENVKHVPYDLDVSNEIIFNIACPTVVSDYFMETFFTHLKSVFQEFASLEPCFTQLTVEPDGE